MKFIRRALIVALILILITVLFCWWNWPRKVDMAQYAPADALVYLECNDIPALARGITATSAWKEIGSTLGLKSSQELDRWVTLAGSFGIGNAQTVVFSRSQVALVLLSLDAIEENSTLNIKPEGALIVETHTSPWRLKPVLESSLQHFAEKTYGPVTLKRYNEDADYLEWSPAAGNRRIVAAVDGSVAIVGNSKRAVQACLESRRGQRPSLRGDTALRRMRAKVDAAHALTFGYVSSGNATKLFSWAAPILIGREPGDSNLARILTKNAEKILGAIGWSSRLSNGGIEDRFFVSLEPSVVTRLQPAFKLGPANGSFWSVVPGDVESITIYRAETPVLAWNALRAVSSQFDALSAVLFNSLLKSALMPYGIEDAQRFLNAVGPELATMKLRQGSDGTILLARAVDRIALQQMFQRGLSKEADLYVSDVGDKKFAAAFVDQYFVIGDPDDVRGLLEARNSKRTMQDDNRLRSLTAFTPETSASIVTYANDNERVRNFLATVSALKGGSAKPPDSLSNSRVLFATTETGLDDEGLERRTRSAFGQFSTLVGLLKQQ
jgi:hypothetical protein